MFEKIGQAAERVAAKVSRRDVLGQFGKSALAVASLLAGLFAFPTSAEAAPARYRCCYYTRGQACISVYEFNCPPTTACGSLVRSVLSVSCRECIPSGC
jgi:hypothetical protein